MRRLTLERVFFICVIAIGAAAIYASTVVAAAYDTSPKDNRKLAVESRNSAFNRAKALYPDPVTKNFPLRKELVEMTQREDMAHHPWYIYILGQNGNTIGYYVAKSVPQNACNFLSSTEDIYSNDQGIVKMQSPSYDGVYYGGSVCDAWFFFDAATNAEIQIRGVNFYTSDQPLRLNAQAIKVAPSK